MQAKIVCGNLNYMSTLSFIRNILILYNDQYKAKYAGKKLIMTLCALYTHVCIYMYILLDLIVRLVLLDHH